MKDKPKFLLVCGAPKSGTTTIFDTLSADKNLQACTVKEPQYWNSDLIMRQNIDKRIADTWIGQHIRLTQTIEDYLKLFDITKFEQDLTLLEASNSYLFMPEALDRIQEVFTLEILLLLRNPVDRAISHYNMYERLGLVDNPLRDLELAILENQTFGTQNDWFTQSKYSMFLPKILNSFNCQIINFDALQTSFEIRYFNSSFTYESTKALNQDNGLRFPTLNKYLRMVQRNNSFPFPNLDLKKLKSVYHGIQGYGANTTKQRNEKMLMTPLANYLKAETKFYEELCA